MRDQSSVILCGIVCVMVRGLRSKFTACALTTFAALTPFASFAPERPVAAPSRIVLEPAAIPVERLWPREADLVRTFSFPLDTAGRPFSETTPAQVAVSVPDAGAPVAAPTTSEAPPNAFAAVVVQSDPALDAPGRTIKAQAAPSKSRTARRAVAVAPMLPPVRPPAIEASLAGPKAAESAAPEAKPVRLLGMTLPGWLPTGDGVADTVAALGGAVRDRLSF